MEIIQVLPGKVWGGAEQYALDLAKSMANAGHKVSIVANPADAIRHRLRAESLPVHYLKVGSIISAPRFAKIIGDADVIHLQSLKHIPWAVIAMRLAGSQARLIATRHDARASRTLPWHRPFYGNVDRIIFVSDLTRRLWTSVNGFFPADKCRVILNSIKEPNAQAEPVPSLRELYDIPTSVPILAFAGRVRHSKGCETILRALARLQGYDYRMIFIGACKPAGYIDKLKKMAADLGVADRVIFHGFSNNVQALIPDIDLSLQPSIMREACPLTHLEMMSHAKCVITSTHGGHTEFIKDGETGFLVKADDDEALAARISQLLNDPALRKRVGTRAQEYYLANMTYPAFLQRTLDVYRGD